MKRIGVAQVECVDCTKETAEKKNELRKALSGEIAKRPVAKLSSIDEMDRAATATELRGGESLFLWLQRVGEKAGIEKIVSIKLIEHEKKYLTDRGVRFRLEINVIDVKTGTIDIVAPAEAETVEEFDQIAVNTADMIARVYYGHSELTGTTDVSFTFSFLYPHSDLRSRGAGNGFGTHLNLYVTKPIWILFTLGVYIFDTEKASIKSLYMMPVGIHLPYYIPLSVNMKLIPSIGAGMLFSMLEADTIGYRPSGNYLYRVGYYYNPIITLRLESNILIYNRYTLVVTPFYSYVFGHANRSGNIFAIDAGFKIHF